MGRRVQPQIGLILGEARGVSRCVESAEWCARVGSSGRGGGFNPWRSIISQIRFKSKLKWLVHGASVHAQGWAGGSSRCYFCRWAKIRRGCGGGFWCGTCCSIALFCIYLILGGGFSVLSVEGFDYSFGAGDAILMCRFGHKNVCSSRCIWLCRVHSTFSCVRCMIVFVEAIRVPSRGDGSGNVVLVVTICDDSLLSPICIVFHHYGMLLSDPCNCHACYHELTMLFFKKRRTPPASASE